MDPAGERSVKRLHEEGEKVARYFESLSPAEWLSPMYETDSAWTVRDILAHFVSAEGAYHALLEDIRCGGAGASPDFDIDAFNAAEVASLRGLTPAALLRTFRDARAQTIRIVASLSPEERSRRGRHPWLGDAPIEDMIQLIYRHSMIHLRDVRKVLEMVRATPQRESRTTDDARGGPA
jgi:hypothetical protein